MGNENEVRAATGMSKEIISLIQTENVGYEVSITRSVKVGRTATESTSVKMSGNAKDKDAALQLLKDLDAATMQFIKDEAAFYGVDLKKASTTPSPLEARKEG